MESVSLRDIFLNPAQYLPDLTPSFGALNIDWNDIDNFDFKKTVFARPFIPICSALGYLVVLVILRGIFGGPVSSPPKSAGGGKPAKKSLSFFDMLCFLHNSFLSVLSLAMCTSCIYETVMMVARGEDVTCMKKLHGRLEFVYFVFHISKTYELLDTVILVIKRKPLIFLHVYHHCVMVPLTWLWLTHDFTLQYWAVIVNSGVHVLMYAYYAATLLGKDMWWKSYLTSLQIIQFISIFIYMIYWAFIQYSMPTNPFPVSVSYDPQQWLLISFPKVQDYPCLGTLFSFTISFFVDCSFLVLFLNFYVRQYVFKGSKDKKQKRA